MPILLVFSFILLDVLNLAGYGDCHLMDVMSFFLCCCCYSFPFLFFNPSWYSKYN